MSTKKLNDLIQNLPKALRPPPNKSTGLSEGFVRAIEAVDTLNQLPPGRLKARLGVHYSPPKFDFGWPIPESDVVVVLQASYPECCVYTTITDGTTRETRQVFDQRKSLADVQEVLGISKQWTLCFEDSLQINDGDTNCLALTNSYENGNETPEREVIEQIKSVFGLEEEPRWFLDFHDAVWCRRLFFRHESGELIATTDFW